MQVRRLFYWRVRGADEVAEGLQSQSRKPSPEWLKSSVLTRKPPEAGSRTARPAALSPDNRAECVGVPAVTLRVRIGSRPLSEDRKNPLRGEENDAVYSPFGRCGRAEENAGKGPSAPLTGAQGLMTDGPRAHRRHAETHCTNVGRAPFLRKRCLKLERFSASPGRDPAERSRQTPYGMRRAPSR